MKDLGVTCRDVRTREVGIQEIHHKIQPHEVELIRRDYVANNGWETFLSYEDPLQDILVGLLRLRKCSSDTFRYSDFDYTIIFRNFLFFQAVSISIVQARVETQLFHC